jgi:hypothetical protein
MSGLARDRYQPYENSDTSMHTLGTWSRYWPVYILQPSSMHPRVDEQHARLISELAPNGFLYSIFKRGPRGGQTHCRIELQTSAAVSHP